MKTLLLLAGMALFCSCSSSKPESKYDFSNVQSLSLDAQIYNTDPRNIMTDTVIIVSQSSQFHSKAVRFDSITAPQKFDFSNVESISTDGMQPAPKASGAIIIKPEPTVQKPVPLKN